MHKFKLSDFKVEKQIGKLSNGVGVLHLKKEAAPISITLASKSGSRFDPKGKEGLAHFVEHMLFEGTEKFKGANAIERYIQNIGGYTNAATSHEGIYCEFTVAGKDDLAVVKDIVSEIFNNPLFLQETVEKERKTIFTEISGKLQSPAVQAGVGLGELLFANAPLAMRTLAFGTLETVKKVTREDIVDFHKNQLPNGLVIVSCGDVDIEDITKTFDDILPAVVGKTYALVKPNTSGKTGVKRRKDESDAVCIEMGFPAVKIGHEDETKLLFLRGLLGGSSLTSLLGEKLRVKEGLVYFIGCSLFRAADCGVFGIDYKVRKDALGRSLELVNETLAQVKSGKFDKSYISLLKNRITKSGLIRLQTSSAWVDIHDTRELLIGDHSDHIDYMNAIQRVTFDDVVAVANKYLLPESMFTYAVGDITEEDLRF